MYKIEEAGHDTKRNFSKFYNGFDYEEWPNEADVSRCSGAISQQVYRPYICIYDDSKLSKNSQTADSL